MLLLYGPITGNVLDKPMFPRLTLTGLNAHDKMIVLTVCVAVGKISQRVNALLDYDSI